MFVNYAELFSFLNWWLRHSSVLSIDERANSLSFHGYADQVYCRIVEFVSHFMHKQQSNSMWRRNVFACGRKLYFANSIRKYAEESLIKFESRRDGQIISNLRSKGGVKVLLCYFFSLEFCTMRSEFVLLYKKNFMKPWSSPLRICSDIVLVISSLFFLIIYIS